jgi:hypothetical protein
LITESPRQIKEAIFVPLCGKQKALAGGTLLQMDQAEPADQDLYGTSENAVKSQIWIAVSVYLMFAIIKKRLKIEASLYTFLQTLSVSAFRITFLIQLFIFFDYKNRSTVNSNQLNL